VGSSACGGVRGVKRRKNGLCDMFICERLLLDCQVRGGVKGGHVTWTTKVVVSVLYRG
jgi:hypothetical protein